MNPSEITLLLGVDAKHANELRWVWPTWMKFKPELRLMPCVVFYDPTQITPDRLEFLKEHENIRLIPWWMPGAASQRERMLTGFVQVPAREVDTPWYLKIDTDVVATAPGKWIKTEWFAPDETGEPPVFVASKWNYTKPSFVMDLLDQWADNIPILAANPRLNIPWSSAVGKLKHPRIISWLFFGQTKWTREIASLIEPEGRLPYPSQDSFMFYCAKRLGLPYVRTSMSNYQWSHKRLRQIKEIVRQMKRDNNPSDSNT